MDPMELPTMDAPPGGARQRSASRSTTDRHLGGVGPAVAQYLGVSVTVARVGLALSVLLGGLGLVLYAALWLVVPDDRGRVLIRGQVDEHREVNLAAVVAGLAAVPLTMWVTSGGPDLLVPVLVAAGVFILGRRGGPVDGEPAVGGLGSPPPPAPPMPPVPPTFLSPPSVAAPPADEPPVPPADAPPVPPADAPPADAPGAPAGPLAEEPTALAEPLTDPTVLSDREPTTRSMPVLAPEDRTAVFPRALPPRGAPSRPVAVTPRPPKPPKPTPFLGPLTVSIAVALAGSLSLLHAIGAIELQPSDVLIAVLVVIGLGLLVSTWFGRARGLILLGLLLAPMVLVSAAIDRVDLRGGIGDRAWTPTAPAQLRPEYRLGAGAMRLDLTELDPSDGGAQDAASTQLTSAMSLGAGLVEVIVPEDWTLELTAMVELGSVWRYDGGLLVPTTGELPAEAREVRYDLIGEEDWWFPASAEVPNLEGDQDGTRHVVRVEGGADAPSLELDVELTAGVVEVFRVQS
jgi:phage shock protein PspC (stress-responsive transcriptional regulator)